MSNHQIHYGRKFYLDKKTGYWISTTYSKEYPRVRAQQWIWIKNHGNIPKGYHIHHVNNDKSDNRIENLELIKAARHAGHHMQKKLQDPEIRKFFKDNCDRIRHLTKAWHSSPEGIAWHRYNAIKCKFGVNEKIKYNCQHCSKEYESSGITSRFCSNNCKSANRKKSGVDNVVRLCSVCGSEFVINKYTKTKKCKRNCKLNGKDSCGKDDSQR